MNRLNPPLLLISHSGFKIAAKHVCSSCSLSRVSHLSATPFCAERLGIYPIGLQNFVLFRAALLKRVKVKITGVRASVPWRSVCNLSPNTINATGIDGNQVSFGWKYLLFAGSHASPVWTSPYLELWGLFWSTVPVKHHTLLQSLIHSWESCWLIYLESWPWCQKQEL